jgi:hypothetical protein
MRKGVCWEILLLSITHFVSAQQMDCQCDVTISQSGIYKATDKVLPGQTICIKAGNYTHLQFFNYAGTPGNPIKFINCGGQVVVSSAQNPSGISFNNCKHFLVSGSGGNEMQRLPYGIKITQTGPGAHGISVANLSTDCEIEHVEVSGADFAGIMTKTDPGCDPASWQQNFVMRNVKIHDTYIHDVKGEGLYLGNSFWSTGMTRTCNGVQMTLFPHNIYGLEVFNNIIERTGAEGLQYACAPDALVHHNIILNAGQSPFAAFQNNGAQIGGGASGKFYNNIILNSPAIGLIIIGHYSTVQAYNNLIVNADIGVFCDDRQGSLSNVPMYFLNNSIINCTTSGMRLYNEGNYNTIANNVIANVKTGNYFGYSQGASAKLSKNILTSASDSLKFINPALFDFRPKQGSPLIDAGMASGGPGFFVDLGDNTRPLGKSIDVGAFEFVNKFALLKPKLLLLVQALVTPADKREGTNGSLRMSIFQDSIARQTAHIIELTATKDEENLLLSSVDRLLSEFPAHEPGKQLKLYPSPASSQLTIEAAFEMKKVGIYNSEGKCLKQSEIIPASKSVQLSLASYPPGSYFVRVENSTTSAVSKFFKE